MVDEVDPETALKFIMSLPLELMLKAKNQINLHLKQFRKDPFVILPVELIVKIFAYLPLKPLMTAYTVSKQWNKVLTSTNRFWETKYLNLYDNPITDQKQYENEFKRKFKLRKNWKFGRFQRMSFESHQENIYCVEFNDNFVYTGSRDMTIKVWNTQTMMLAKTLIGHNGSVLSLRQTELYLVSGSADHSIIVWDLYTGNIKMQFRGHGSSVLSIAVEKDIVISGSKDNSIKMWDIKQQKLIHTFWGHEASVNGVAFKNGIICSGSAGFLKLIIDRTVKVWDSIGNMLLSINAHSRGVNCIDFNGILICSGSSDHSLKVWDLEGNLLKTFSGHEDITRSLQMSNTKIISASYDKKIIVWDIQKGLERSWNCFDPVICVRFDEEKIICTHKVRND